LTLESLECLRGDEARCKQVAYTLSRLSEHPLSRAIQKLGRQWRVNAAEVTQFETLPGQGLRANIGGRIFLLGNGQLAGIAPRSSPSTNSLGLEVWVAGEDLLGRMGFRGRARPEAERNPAEPRRDGGCEP
jgi:cation transport ATPase